jgi:hypothetical protein
LFGVDATELLLAEILLDGAEEGTLLSPLSPPQPAKTVATNKHTKISAKILFILSSENFVAFILPFNKTTVNN